MGAGARTWHFPVQFGVVEAGAPRKVHRIPEWITQQPEFNERVCHHLDILLKGYVNPGALLELECLKMAMAAAARDIRKSKAARKQAQRQESFRIPVLQNALRVLQKGKGPSIDRLGEELPEIRELVRPPELHLKLHNIRTTIQGILEQQAEGQLLRLQKASLPAHCKQEA